LNALIFLWFSCVQFGFRYDFVKTAYILGFSGGCFPVVTIASTLDCGSVSWDVALLIPDSPHRFDRRDLSGPVPIFFSWSLQFFFTTIPAEKEGVLSIHTTATRNFVVASNEKVGGEMRYGSGCRWKESRRRWPVAGGDAAANIWWPQRMQWLIQYTKPKAARG
jgi:hypothetical protein